MRKQISTVAIAASLGACATLPDVTYKYYQTKSATVMAVTQNLQCVKDPDNKTKKPVYSALDFTTTIATPVTSYAADYGQDPVTVKVKKLDGFLSDTDANFTFLEDGRLASMNTTLTGQAETILKSAISLGTSVAGFAALAVVDENPERAKKEAERAKKNIDRICQILAGWPNADKLSLTFTKTIDFGAEAKTWLDQMAEWREANRDRPPAQRAPLPPLPSHILNRDDGDLAVSDVELYNCLSQKSCKTPFPEKVNLPAVRVTLGAIDANRRVVTYDAEPNCDPNTNNHLCLQDTATVRLDYAVSYKPPGEMSEVTKPATSSNAIIVPLRGDHYRFALPKPAWFGAGKAALALAPSGAVTNAEYSKTNGAAGAMNVGTAAFTAATPAATVPAPVPPPDPGH